MWTEIAPRPSDFCGHPPCPRCYRWKDGDQPASFAQFALEFLGREPKGADVKAVKKIADKLHDGVFVSAPITPADGDGEHFEVDIGMTTHQHLNGILKELRPANAVAPPRQLTCDEIATRQADRKARKDAKDKEKQERLREAREVAEVFAAAQQSQNREREYMESRMAREMEPRFLEEMRMRGMSVEQAYSRWQQMTMQYDPRAPISGMKFDRY